MGEVAPTTFRTTHVKLSIDDGIAHLTLDRPDKSNAVDLDMARDLQTAVLACSGSEVRAVLLDSNGPNFCGGGQVADLVADPGADPGPQLATLTAVVHTTISLLARLQAPVIVAARGFAVGGGLGLAMIGDIVIAGESVKFMSGFTRIGLSPDSGVSYSLPRLVGVRIATDLVLTNRVVEAAEALRIGLVSRVVPDEELASTAWETARSIAAGPPSSFASSKRLLLESQHQTLEGQLANEALSIQALSRTFDGREGITAMIERRAPRFTGK